MFIVGCCIFFQVKQQDLAKAIHCLCGRFKIFEEAGYHNLAPDINNFESRLNHYESGKIKITLCLHSSQFSSAFSCNLFSNIFPHRKSKSSIGPWHCQSSKSISRHQSEQSTFPVPHTYSNWSHVLFKVSSAIWVLAQQETSSGNIVWLFYFSTRTSPSDGYETFFHFSFVEGDLSVVLDDKDLARRVQIWFKHFLT